MEFTIQIKTSTRDQCIDITRKVKEFIWETGFDSGLCFVYVPHTTSGVTVNENADPSVREDLITVLRRLVPLNDPDYEHVEGNTAAHVKSVLVGSSVTVPVINKKLMLGTWQGILFCEFDGPRSRTVQVYLK
ncbi:MAG: secondary thiamine-phosphate synthase enzyme YjbQ [Candidatus Odinarchaeota archaeon]